MFRRVVGTATLVLSAAVAILLAGGATAEWSIASRNVLVATMAFLLGVGVTVLLIPKAISDSPESNDARSVGWLWAQGGDWLDLVVPQHQWMMMLPSGDVAYVGRTVTLGSSSACDVVIDEPFVLPYHAKMRWNGAQVVVTDLSDGQLFVDGQRIRGSLALNRGAKIRLGGSEVVLHRDVSGVAGTLVGLPG